MADSEAGPAEAEPGGSGRAPKKHPATTTISTISLQSGDTKLVIALLQCGESLQLKMLEGTPEVTQLGATLAEALALQRQHEEVLLQLQNKQSPVEELLRQADQLISTQRPRAEVYAAMAESLGVAWKDINSHLELRKHILELNVAYQSRAEECIERMLALEMACRDTSIPVEIDAVKLLLRRLQDLKRLMLESLMVTLQDGRALHEKMKEVAAQGTLDSRPDRITVAANYTVSQIEHWLEDLHDRRKLLEEKWLSTKTQLEQCLCLALLAQDLKELDEALAMRRESLKRTGDQMGDSASSAELLLHEHKKLTPEAREFQDRCLKITKSTEKLISSGHFAVEEATARAYVVLNSCAEYSNALEQREAMLNRAITFFRSAHTAFTKLDQLEIQLTNTDLSQSNLVHLHSLATKTLEEITVPLLQEGYSLMEAIGSSAPGAEGVKRTIQEVENRKLSLENLCLAHKEENIILSRDLTTFLGKHNELYSWLVSIAEAFLQGHQDMGSVLAMAEDFLQLHQQLLSDVQNKGIEINELLLTLPPLLEKLNDDQRTDIDEKVDTLHSHWLTLKTILEARVDLANLYVKFHSLSVELANEFDAMEAEFKKGSGTGQEDFIRHVEQKWLHIQQLYGQLSNLGKSFIEESSKVEDPYLDGKRASLCVETLLEHFGSRQLVITESWQTWQNNITVEHECKVLWTRNLTESDRTIDWVSTFETQLYPVLTGESSTSSILVKELEEKLRVVLSELKKAQTEIELRVKTAENLATKGDFQGQKEDLIHKLMQQYNKLSSSVSDYQILLQMLISFLKNLSELEKTVENLQSQYRPTLLPNTSSEVDALVKEHEASKQAVLEMFKFTQKESEQIINRIKQQEPEKEARFDIERVFRLLEIKKLAWESAWTDRKLLLEKHHQLCQFDSDLQQINVTLDDLSKQLTSIKGQYGESLNSAKATSLAFVYFEKTIQLLETRIETFVSTAEHAMKSEHASVHVEQESNRLQSKWSSFRNQVNESRRLIDLSIEYFTLVEEAEEWFHKGSKLLVTIARKSTAVKVPQEATQLLTEVDNFLKSGEIDQQERIKKITTLAIQLYGEERPSQVTLVVNENKEMIDSFTKISEELKILAQNLRDAEEQRERQKKELEEADAILETTKAEAAAARAAAAAAEEARKAAEAAAKVLHEAILIERVEFETAIPVVPEAKKETETARTPSPPHKKAKVSEDIPRPSAPIFTVPLHDANIQEGKQFTFECRVTGFPVPEVIWYKDGISIQSNPDYQTVFDQGICTLTIEETFTEDSARFTCKATNAAGTAETNATLSVKEAEPEEQLAPPVFIKRIETGSAKEGSTFHLMCSVQGNPLPTIQWFKNDICIDNISDYVITYNNGEAVLKFEEIFLEDQADYTCKASNPLGIDTCTARLNVEPLEPTEAPEFIIPLSNIMARAGRKIKLSCEVAGLPLPELIWTHNGKIIKETRDIKLQFEDGKGTLVVNEAFPKDAGIYTVVAKNISGEASCSCNVSVKGRLPTETSDSEIASDLEPIKPSIQLSLKDINVEEGKEVRLDCIIVGQPEPEVIWYHNTQPVKESSDFQLLFQGDRCSLIIREAYLEDAGEYKVVAINSGGEASSFCNLTVKASEETEPALRSQREILEMPQGAPPKFSKLLTDILAPEGEKVFFECTVLGDPKPAIKWYLNNQEITDITSKQFSEDAQGNVSLTLLEVSPQDKGVYTIKASNTFGEAKCFANLIVKSSTPQDAQTRVQMEEKITHPSFKELFADRTVPENSSTKFECIVTGKPTPKVRWIFNNEPVAGHDFLVSTSGERQVLIIQNVRKAHSGNIACTAENEAGKATCAAVLSVTDSEAPLSVPSSTTTTTTTTTTENIESSSFSMKRSVFMQSSSQTSSSIHVMGTAEPQVQKLSITSHSEQSTQQSGQKSPVQVKSHTYKEIMRNNECSDIEHQSFVKISSGGEDTQDSSCYSTPIASPKPVRKSVAPRFITPLNGKIVDQGAEVVLEGIIDGYPQPSVTWTKNGKEIISKDGKLSIKYDHNRVEIIIKDAMVEDAGRYTCKAVNSMGSASSTADVVVKKTVFPPVFGRRLHARSVKAGERVVMEVEITGTPTPVVTWFKDGNKILDSIPNQPYQTKIEGNCYSLIIKKATLDHSGQYSVKAINSGGEAETIADFAVYSPEPQIETIKQETLEDLRESIIEKQTQVTKPAAGIQHIPTITTRTPLPSPPVPQRASSPLEKSFISESRIITETTKTEKQMSIKLERTPSPIPYKAVSPHEFRKEHRTPIVDEEKKSESPIPSSSSVPSPIHKFETTVVKGEFEITKSKSSLPSIQPSQETEIRVVKSEGIVTTPSTEISVPMKNENVPVTSKHEIWQETHIQKEEERSLVTQEPTAMKIYKENIVPMKIETSTLENKITSLEPKHNEVKREVKEEKKEPQVSIIEAVAIQINKEPFAEIGSNTVGSGITETTDTCINKEVIADTVSNTVESGVETTSVSKKTALDFFAKKLKESEEDIVKHVKEPIQLPKEEAYDGKSFPEIQQAFNKTGLQSDLDNVDRTSLSGFTSSQFYSEHTASSKFEKKVIYHQHQLSSDSLLEEFNIQPEPPPEMGFIPKSEVAVKKREDVTTRVKKLEETHRVLSPTEIPTGGVRIFPTPVPLEEPQKQQPANKTVFSPVDRQESVSKKEIVEDICVAKEVSLPGSGDSSVQPTRHLSKAPELSPDTNKRKLQETFSVPISSPSSQPEKYVETMLPKPVAVPSATEPPVMKSVTTLPPTLPPSQTFPTNAHLPSIKPIPEHALSEQNLSMPTLGPKPFQTMLLKSENIVMEKPWESSVTKSELVTHSSLSINEHSSEIVRSASPRPSVEGLAMEKLWIPQKPPEPEIIIPKPSTVGLRHIERGASPKPSVEGLAMDKIWAHKRPDSGLRNVWPPPEYSEEKPVIPWTTKSAPEKIWHRVDSAVNRKEEVEVMTHESTNQELTKIEFTPQSNIVKKSEEMQAYSPAPAESIPDLPVVSHPQLVPDQKSPVMDQIPIHPTSPSVVIPAPVPHYVAKTSVKHSAATLESEILTSEITTSTMQHIEIENKTQTSEVFQTTYGKEDSPCIVQESNIRPSESKKVWPPMSKEISHTKSSSLVDTSMLMEHYGTKFVSNDSDQKELISEPILQPEPPPEIGFAPCPSEPHQSHAETIEVLDNDLSKPSPHPVGTLRTVSPPPQKQKVIPPPVPLKEKIETQLEIKHQVIKKETKKTKPVVQTKPFERFPDLEPFPFKPDTPKSRPAPCPPPPKPSKFIKGVFTESDYDSDWESTHIPPKWRPYESDTDDLSYRRVKPPTFVHPQRSKSTEPEPLPPSRFEEPLQLEGPPRPKLDKSFIGAKEAKSTASVKTSTLQTQKAVQMKTHLQTKTEKTRKQTNGFHRKHSPPILKPGSPPEYVQAVSPPKAPEPQPTIVKTDATSATVKPDSPKSRTKAAKDFPESGYMADTDEPRQFRHTIHKSTSIKHEESLKTTEERTTVVVEKTLQSTSQPAKETPTPTEPPSEKQSNAQPSARIQEQVQHHRHHVHQTQKKLPIEESTSFKTLSTKVHHKYSESKHEKKGVTSIGSTKSKKEMITNATPKLSSVEDSKGKTESKLLPFPFQPDPPRPAAKRTVVPPPPSPSKFVKGEFRETGYESDYDSRILPKWKPSDSDADEPTYRPVHPVLARKGHHQSQSYEVRTPTPPTEFDNPPEFAGPPRPKFEPIEKPAQTFKTDNANKSPAQSQKVFKPKPVTPKTVPFIEVVIATPAVKPRESIILEPGPQPEMGYAPPPPRTAIKVTPFENATQIETSKVMNYAESTKHTHRVVNVQQTTRVIKFGEQENKVYEPVHQTFSPKSEPQTPKSKYPPPSRPKKFVPGEFHESEYESDIESVKIKPIWTPGNSDTEEPHYRRVRPPQMTRSSSIPAETSDISFPHKNVSVIASQAQQSCISQKGAYTVKETRNKHDVSSNEQRRASLPIEKRIVRQEDIQLQPGEPPEFGYSEGPKTASYLAAKHMSEMTNTFKSKAQQFASNIMTDVNTARQNVQPEKTILKQPGSVNIKNEKAGDDPQAYREESRVAEYGTKHIDPDTGLIYFKYDFGYEFGIVLPGEGKMSVGGSSKPIMPKQRGDIEVPVIHEKTSLNEDLSNKVEEPKITKATGPQFRPKKFTHFKSVKWEPASESEMSEAEGDSSRDKKSSNLPQSRSAVQKEPHIHIPSASRWEPAIPSPLSLSLSPSLPSLSPCTGATLDSTASPGGSWQGLSPSKSPHVGHGRGNTPTPPSTPSTPGSVPGHAIHQLRKPPAFITPLRDIAVVKGQTARFECIVQAEPSPNILWAKDGRLLENSEKYHIHYRNGVCRLTLPVAFPEDAGTYSCTATNMLGTIGTSGTLQVPGEKRILSR